MRSEAQRTDLYNAKVAPSTVGLKIAARLPVMGTSFAAATNRLVPKQELVAGVLDDEGIVGLMRGRYQAFGNRLWAITQRFSGLAATTMAQLEHDKWESACDTLVLIRIAADVFNLTVT